MLVPYEKPYLPVESQLALIENRGMIVGDRKAALQAFNHIGYYRLSGYWYPFRQTVSPGLREERFVPGSRFDHVLALYVFDRKLRLLMLDAIERIEVAMRVDIALLMGKVHPWAHLDPKCMHGKFSKIKSGGKSDHDNWVERYRAINDRSKEHFLKHFREKYSSELPIWMAVELWDFGMLSVFFSGMKHEDQAGIASQYGVPNPSLMKSWLRSINFVRNVCAHHGRLWNRPMVDQPKVPKQGEILPLDPLLGNPYAQTRVYAIACIVQLLLMKVNPQSSWHERFANLVTTFPGVRAVSLQDAGFPDQWQEQEIWK